MRPKFYQRRKELQFSRLIKSLTAATLLLSFIGQFAEAKPSAAGWHLRQKSLIYGLLDVFLTNKGVKVVSLDEDFSWMCAAPDWDALLYSDKRKLVCRQSYESWSENGIRTALSLSTNDIFYKIPRILATRRSYCGWNSLVFAFPAKMKNGQASLLDGKCGEYTVERSIQSEARARAFLQALYDVPPDEGLPMKFIKVSEGSYGFGLKHDRTNHLTLVLETLDVKPLAHPMAFNPAAVNAYKLVSESEMLVKKENLNDLFSTFSGR